MVTRPPAGPCRKPRRLVRPTRKGLAAEMRVRWCRYCYRRGLAVGRAEGVIEG